MRVEFYEYNFKDELTPLFTLGVVEGVVAVVGGDADDPLAQIILADRFPLDADGSQFATREDGELFLQLAPQFYSGSRVQAKVVDEQPQKHSKEWEEGKHPRDDEGKFTSGENAMSEEFDKPSFDEWFSDSKVTEDGEPKKVYHGSVSKFDEFEDNVNGIFFSANKDYATNYGPNITEAHLSIKNPLDLSHMIGEVREAFTLQELRDALESNGIDTSYFPDEEDVDEDRYFHISEAFYDPLGDIPDGGIEAARNAGYDGLKLPTEEPENDYEDEVWVAFRPNQIRKT